MRAKKRAKQIRPAKSSRQRHRTTIHWTSRRASVVTGNSIILGGLAAILMLSPSPTTGSVPVEPPPPEEPSPPIELPPPVGPPPVVSPNTFRFYLGQIVRHINIPSVHWRVFAIDPDARTFTLQQWPSPPGAALQTQYWDQQDMFEAVQEATDYRLQEGEWRR